MNPARAIRNDTSPPPETSLRILARDDWYTTGDIVIGDAVELPDSVDIYLPQGSFVSTASVAANYNRHLSAQSAIDHLLARGHFLEAKQSPVREGCIQFQKNFVIVIEEARKTTEAGLLSLVYDNFHADIKAANLLTVPLRGLLSDAPADLLEGYEQYQTADWDGHGAEAITPQTLAYARRLMRVMPRKLGLPDAAPAGDGSIALEWVLEDTTHKLDRLFLDIGPGEVWRAYWTLRTGEFGRLPQAGFSDETKTILNNLFNNLSA